MAACGFSSGALPRASGEEHRASAAAAIESQDFIGALEHLRAALAADPGDSVAYAYLADVHRRAGWTREGYETFRAAVGARGDRPPELRYYLAFFAAYRGLADSAEHWLVEARRVRPPTYAEAITLSDVLLLHRRVQLALGLLEEAVVRFPREATPRVRLVAALAQLGELAEADRVGQLLLRDFPAEPAALAAVAELRFLQGDLAASKVLTEQWLTLAPRSAEARWNLARIAIRRGQWRRADSLLSWVVETRR